MKVDSPGGGRAEARLRVGESHLNPHGTAHGALIHSLAGIARASAANDNQHSGGVSEVNLPAGCYEVKVFPAGHEDPATMTQLSVGE